MRGVGEGVAAAGLGGLDGDLAGGDAVACARDALVQFVLVQRRAAGRVDDHRFPRGGAGLARAGDGRTVGEDGHLADRVHHQGAAVLAPGLRLLHVLGVLHGLGRGVGGRQFRGGAGDPDRALVRQVRAGDRAVLGEVHHQVAADHRQASVGAVVAHVPGAVGVDQHVLGHQALVGAQAELAGGRGRVPAGRAYRLAARVGRHRLEAGAGSGGGGACGSGGLGSRGGLGGHHGHGAQSEGCRDTGRQGVLAVHRNPSAGPCRGVPQNVIRGAGGVLQQLARLWP